MPEDFDARLARLGLDAADFDESFARSGGPGGQHVNKVSTAVTLRHRPSGQAVTVQDSRSQAMPTANWPATACSTPSKTPAAQERRARVDAKEKLRRQNAPRPRAVKRRMLQSKRHRAGIKAARRSRGDE